MKENSQVSFVHRCVVARCGVFLCSCVVSGSVLSQDHGLPPAKQAAVTETPFAFVQGRPVGMAEVRFLLSTLRPATVGQRESLEQWLAQTPLDKEKLEAEIPREVVLAAVDQWIERLVILAFLEREKLAVPRAKVEADLRSWDERLQELGTSLEVYRQASGISHESLFQFRHWELSWQNYLDRRVTAESLQKYFEQFQSEFDGTKKRVAHIVLVIPPLDPNHPADAAERSILQQAARVKLDEVRLQITGGSLTFEQAAAQFSQGTSADTGGELGWVVREGPLSEAVSQAVYRLKLGEISQPIISPHGVHLLVVLEESPGSRTFPQVIEQVKHAAIQQIWRKIIDQESSNLSIERPNLR